MNDEKVISGRYNNPNEVIKDARQAFCRPPEIGIEQDTPELATLLEEGINSRHIWHKKGDIRKILGKASDKTAR